MMWLVLGIAAMAAAMLNIVRTVSRKDASWFRFVSMALTALTLCAFYSRVNEWILREDWSALTDTSAMPGIMWALTIISILLNGVSLLRKSRG